MSEKDSSSRSQGGAEEHISQNYERLNNMPADELLFEFEAKMDGMTDLDYDGKVVDAYLAALDEKAPLDPDIDAEVPWSGFRTKHADLFEKGVADGGASAAEDSKKARPRRLATRIAAITAVVALFGLLCAQAAGFNIFGVFGKWTSEIFGFSPADGGDNISTDFRAKDDNSEIYFELKAVLERCGITEDLVPTWYPEGFKSEPQDVSSTKAYDAICCYFSGENNSHFAIEITRYNDPSKIEAPFFEKDESTFEEYVSGDRLFYILSNLDSTTAIWSDGEMYTIHILGDISTEEIKAIIDSIGG